MAGPQRMLHPRWRWIFAAGQLGRREPTDGLGTAFAPDPHIKQLIRTHEGKGKSTKAQMKAIEFFNSDTTRVLLDCMLLALGNVQDTATLIDASEDAVQWYADWFFDIKVFDGKADKLLYLDKVSQRDPGEADVLRRALDLTREEFKVFLQGEGSENWSVQKSLTWILNASMNLAKAFYPRELEAGLGVENPEKFDRRLALFDKFVNLGLRTAATMASNEMDKTKEEFLQNFVMKLKNPDPKTLIETEKPDNLI